MSSRASELDHANPHALAVIVEASTKRTIVASQDIVDERGVKLWARGQLVSETLQQRLLERKLKQPLEASLQAAEGVDGRELQAAAETFLLSDNPVAKGLMPWSAQLIGEVANLSVQSVAQLMLTAAQAARPGVFDHAVRGMVLAGAMALDSGGDHNQLQLALMAGLLHDLGEMYVDPTYLNASQPLDVNGYRHLLVHPRIGAMLLGQLAKYPPAVARAVSEHHERLDGSGYPGRLAGAAISPLGRLLSVMETTLGITGSAHARAPWAHASFALRMVPGEFDGAAVGFVSATAHRANENLSTPEPVSAESLSLVDGRLAAALLQAEQIGQTTSSPPVKAVAQRAGHLLLRLRIGWNAMGLWAAPATEEAPDTDFEMWLAQRELAYRMRFIRRECLWAEKDQSAADGEALAPLWAHLEPGHKAV